MKKRSFLFSAMTLCISCSMVWSFAEKVSAEDGTPVNDTKVKIDEQHFPDEEFRKQVGYFDDNKDGYLDSQELAAVDRLDIWKNGYRNYIYSIKGVEYFPNLLYIDCSGNRITEIDLSKNTTLLRLSCEMNQLTSLNVSNCTNLLYLVAKTNKLTSIDVSATLLSIVVPYKGVSYLRMLTGMGPSAFRSIEQISQKNHRKTSDSPSLFYLKRSIQSPLYHYFDPYPAHKSR